MVDKLLYCGQILKIYIFRILHVFDPLISKISFQRLVKNWVHICLTVNSITQKEIVVEALNLHIPHLYHTSMLLKTFLKVT